APGAATPAFADHQDFATETLPYYSLALGDVNNDGRPDLVVANSGYAASVSVLMNTTAPGANTPAFATHQAFAIGGRALPVALGDLKDDGTLDIVSANVNASTVSVLLNTTRAT